MQRDRASNTSKIITDPDRFHSGNVHAEAIDDLWAARTDDNRHPVEDLTGRGSAHLPKNLGRAMSDVSGDDKYIIEKEIARGGMGVALLAFDRDIRRHVVMKVMKDRTDLEHRSRFVEEAQVTGQLEHPNIIPVHELGVDATGRLFFAMKHVRGKTLGEILDDCREHSAIAEEKHPISEMVHALIHVCDAVSYAHTKGVIHRDLKPGNIMLGDHGEIYVMDWGLARVGIASRRSQRIKVKDPAATPATVPVPRVMQPHERDELIDEDEEMVDSYRHDSALCITRNGTIAGTPAYMPPEQAGGDLEAIDNRSDVYSLGAILYEILTLYPPVKGMTDEDYINNVKRGAIIPIDKRNTKRNYPHELGIVAMQALSFKPENRYADVAEFKKELVHFLSRETLTAEKPHDLKTSDVIRKHPFITTICLMLAAAAGSAITYLIMNNR